jgi:hypothetical protein
LSQGNALVGFSELIEESKEGGTVEALGARCVVSWHLRIEVSLLQGCNKAQARHGGDTRTICAL